jgi:hypothetical protein
MIDMFFGVCNMGIYNLFTIESPGARQTPFQGSVPSAKVLTQTPSVKVYHTRTCVFHFSPVRFSTTREDSPLYAN